MSTALLDTMTPPASMPVGEPVHPTRTSIAPTYQGNSLGSVQTIHCHAATRYSVEKPSDVCR